MTAPAPTAVGLGSAARRTLARGQFWIILLVLGALTAAAMQLMDQGEARPYALGSTELDGYGAFAAVMEDEGITVHAASSGTEARELMGQLPDAGVVTMLPPNLGRGPEGQLSEELLSQVSDGQRQALWILGDSWAAEHVPEELPQGALPLETGPAGTAPEIPAGSECQIDAAQSSESIQSPGVVIPGDEGCFPVDPEGHLLADTPEGLVLGAPDAFANRQIERAGNAALALSLAQDLSGEDDQLIWYTPSADDSPAGEEDWLTPGQLLDDWMLPLMGWLVLAALIGILAAGRRYGPVVAEPMPANVPAGELTEGRARLYQRAHAHSRAADALRQGTLRRLGRTLRLGTHPEPHAAARAAAHRTGRDPQELTALLEHPRVDSSTDLVTYAQALQTLEQQTTTVNTPTEENR